MKTLIVQENELQLLPEKGVFWVEESALILSDVHIGKSGHFRKHGIAIPALTNKNNHWRIVEVLEKTNPKKIVFLGDLSHSTANEEWDDFADFMQQFPTLEKVLVKGNHDIIPEEKYAECGIVVQQHWQRNGLDWVHELGEEKSDVYQLGGHVHPGIRLRGGAKQSIVLPCFYFSKRHALLPAFGEFTGLAMIKPKKGDKVWVIAENTLTEIKIKT